MSNRGFSTAFVEAVQAADSSLPAVQLAKLCIAQDVPMVAAATHLRVTRATMYNWAVGRTAPHPRLLARVIEYARVLQAQA